MASTNTRRWLLGNDGSAGAMHAARYVARWWCTFAVERVEVVTAVAGTGRLRAPADAEGEARLDDVHTEDTQRVVAVLQRSGADVQCTTTQGSPADVILREAQLRNVSEILVGFCGTPQSTVLALGSVAYKVVHHAACPVTVVSDLEPDSASSRTGSQGAQQVLLAVDGSDHALEAVRYLCGLAKSGQSISAWLVNVQIPIVSAYIRRFVSRDMIEMYHQEEGADALRAATKVLTDAGVPFQSQIHVGHVAETIVQLAGQLGSDRIVMGARGMGTLAGLVLGSTAYKVLHTARVPVTLVRSATASSRSIMV